jgi:hypothetical protein
MYVQSCWRSAKETRTLQVLFEGTVYERSRLCILSQYPLTVVHFFALSLTLLIN